MKEKSISVFMLERYRLNELNSRDKKEVESVLAKDGALRSILEELDKSDSELRLRYPSVPVGQKNENTGRFPKKRFTGAKLKISVLIAAILLCALLPVFIINRNAANIDFKADRPKGQLPAGSEIFIYLKGDFQTALQEATFLEAKLPNQKLLREGDTVQLAYIAPAGAQYYGVIFSIDGRDVVTMHYPYQKGQSPLLVSGRQTFLNEAYTLDDAPDYEVFVFVVCEQPLDVNMVRTEAQRIADKAKTPEQIKEISKKVFNTCEIETITVLKK